MKISLENARQLLEDSEAILIDGVPVRPKFSEPAHANDPFLILEWQEDGLHTHLEFDPDGNRKVNIDEETMTLEDTDGDHHELKLLGATHLEDALRC